MRWALACGYEVLRGCPCEGSPCLYYMACDLLWVAGLEVNSTREYQVVPIVADATTAIEV